MKSLFLTAKAIPLTLALFAILWFGYMLLADYGDGVASGTYEARVNGETTTLLLRTDHTFHQRRVINGVPSYGDGTWHRVGEGGLVLSGRILLLPDQRLMPNGDAYATLYKTLGIWPFISVDSTTTAPIYRKTLFGRSH